MSAGQAKSGHQEVGPPRDPGMEFGCEKACTHLRERGREGERRRDREIGRKRRERDSRERGGSREREREKGEREREKVKGERDGERDTVKA